MKYKIFALVTLFFLFFQSIGVGLAYEVTVKNKINSDPLLKDIVDQYQKQRKSKGKASLLNISTSDITTLSQTDKNDIITSSISTYGVEDIKVKYAKLSENDKKAAVNAIDKSIRKDNSYYLIIKSSLTLDELTKIFSYLTGEEGIKINNYYKKYTSDLYELKVEKNSKLGNIFDDYLDNGVIPENLFGKIEIVTPELVKVDAYSTGFYLGEATDVWGINKIGANKYQYTLSQEDKIKVGVLDTGVNITHNDLKANIFVNKNEIAGNGVDDDFNGLIDDVNGYNFVTSTGNVDDVYGHGTHVSGTIGAALNGQGVYGVNSNAVLVPIKVLSDSGYGSTYGISNGIRYAADMGVKVINMSLGGAGVPNENDIMCSAITYAKSKGTITVASAGNSNIDVSGFSPAGCMNAFAVGALDSNYAKAYFSNFGTGVTISAPGVGIKSTTKGNTYGQMSGTSMAGPHVAGAISAILAATGGLSVEQVRSLLVASGDKLVATNMGVGLNLDAAMKMAGVKEDSLYGSSTVIRNNLAPSVTMSNYVYNTVTNGYVVTANATDIDGTIVKYDFYAGDVLKQSGLKKTLTIDITANTNIKVVVTDDKGATGQSTITLTYTKPAPVDMTMEVYPTELGDYVANIIYRTSTGSDVGTVPARYNFYLDGALKQEGYSSTFKFTPITRTVVKGEVIVPGANPISKEVVVTPTIKNIAPVISASVIDNGNNNYTIVASGSDADGQIVGYEFAKADAIVQTGSSNKYTTTLSSTGYFFVSAIDNLGARGSTQVVIYPKFETNTPPVATLTVTYSGSNVYNITPSATDKENNLVYQQLFINGSVYAVSSGSTNIPAFKYTTTKPTEISYIAYDAKSLSGKVVKTLGYANILPTATLTSVRVEPNVYDVTATGADANGTVVKYELYDSGTLIYSGSETPKVVRKKVTAHTPFKLVVTDNEGGQTVRNITLYYYNILPTASFTSKKVALNEYEIYATGADANGSVVRYEIYDSGVLVYSGSEIPPVLKKIVKINTPFKLIVTDNEGGQTTRTLTLYYYNTPPTATLSSIRIEPNVYDVTATGADLNGTVVKYELYDSGTLIYSGSETPKVVRKKVTSHTPFKLVVTDNEGAQTVRNITLYYYNILPTMGMAVKKIANNTYEISASGADANGYIAKYELYESGVLTYSGKDFPTTTKKVTANLPIKLVVTDNEGGQTYRTSTLYYTNVLPTLTLSLSGATSTSPIAGTVKNLNTIKVNGFDENGRIVKYNVYKNNVLDSFYDILTQYTVQVTANTVYTIEAIDNEGGSVKKSITLYYVK